MAPSNLHGAFRVFEPETSELRSADRRAPVSPGQSNGILCWVLGPPKG